MRTHPQAAFTLVELLLVVVILGILAAVAIPQFSDSSTEARASSLQSNLAVMRQAIEYYRTNHNGKYPGYPSAGGAPTAGETANQLTLASKADAAQLCNALAPMRVRCACCCARACRGAVPAPRL